MKEVKVEKITYVTEYEATDGTHFTDKSECIKYDASAKNVLNTRLKQFAHKQIVENELFGIGSEEYEYLILKPTSEEHLKTILHYYELTYGNYEAYNNNKEKLLENLKINSILLFGIGCAYDNYDGFYFYGSADSIIDDIKNKLF